LLFILEVPKFGPAAFGMRPALLEDQASTSDNRVSDSGNTPLSPVSAAKTSGTNLHTFANEPERLGGAKRRGKIRDLE